MDLEKKESGLFGNMNKPIVHLPVALKLGGLFASAEAFDAKPLGLFRTPSTAVSQNILKPVEEMKSIFGRVKAGEGLLFKASTAGGGPLFNV